MSDNRILKISSWIRGCHVYKDWWTLNVVKFYLCNQSRKNAEDKNAVAVLKENRVVGHIPFHLANTKNRTGIVTHFILKPTSQGSVEIYGKAINRGGGLVMEIYHVFTFFMVLENTWIYLKN